MALWNLHRQQPEAKDEALCDSIRMQKAVGHV
jgi:hypothetical protein